MDVKLQIVAILMHNRNIVFLSETARENLIYALRNIALPSLQCTKQSAGKNGSGRNHTNLAKGEHPGVPHVLSFEI